MSDAQQLHNNADVSNIFYFFFFLKKILDTSTLLCNYYVRVVKITYLIKLICLNKF
jgi:hypothetical protein